MDNKPTGNETPEEMQAQIRHLLHDGRNWLMGIGILLLLMGVLAMAAPVFASTAITIWIGIAFLIGGIGQMAHGYMEKTTQSMLSHTLLGAFYVLGGALLTFKPLTGMIAISLFVVASLLISGIFRIIAAFKLRPAEGWQWLLLAGVISAATAGIIYASFPGSAMWLLGALAGLSFLFEGWSLIALSIHARRMR